LYVSPYVRRYFHELGDLIAARLAGRPPQEGDAAEIVGAILEQTMDRGRRTSGYVGALGWRVAEHGFCMPVWSQWI
jgi:hypothetical protein